MRLEVECSIVWVTTERNSTALLELEVFFDNVLDGELVDAVVDVVVAKHIEAALIIIGGTYGTIAVEGNVVARLLVHDDLQRGTGCSVDVEVQTYVGGYVSELVVSV